MKNTKIESWVYGKIIFNIKISLGLIFIISILFFQLSCNGDARAVESDEQMHGVWIATVYNIDWPSKTNLTETSQKSEIDVLLDGFEDVGITDIIFQVKPAQEVFYKSDILPYSRFLSGKYTNDYEYDPLKYIIKEAHKRDMKVHAWSNPFRILDKEIFLEYVDVAKEEWIVKHGKYYWLDPAIKEVREFVISTIIEIVDNYDIDGIHIDDYFYPYSIKGSDFNDEASYKKYRRFLQSKGDFRRDAINKFVYTLASDIKSSKNDVVFGVSPFAIWRNHKDDKKGSKTFAMQTSYDTLYADTRKWFRDGILDYMAPQIYFDNANTNASFDNVLKWWEKEAKSSKTPLYIGMPAFKATYSNFTITNYISNFNKINGNKNIKGMLHYSAKHIVDKDLGLKDFLSNNIKN